VNTAIMLASTSCPLAMKFKVRKTDAIAAIPVANPSMLSSRLIALVMPMSQKIVIAMFTDADRVQGRVSP